MTRQCASTPPNRIEDNTYHRAGTADTASEQSVHDAVSDPLLPYTASAPSIGNCTASPSPPSSSIVSRHLSNTSTSLRPMTARTNGPVPFRSQTSVPSPPLTQLPPTLNVETLDACSDVLPRSQFSALAYNTASMSGPINPHGGVGTNMLRLETDVPSCIAFPAPVTSLPHPSPSSPDAIASATTPTVTSSGYIRPSTLVLQHKISSSSLMPMSRTPSLKTTGGPGVGTTSAASSTVPSPIISAMGDVTPLPSPLLSSDSPGPWRKLGRSPSRDTQLPQVTRSSESAFVTSNGESIASALTHQAKRKAYAELLTGQNAQRDHSNSLFQTGQVQADAQPLHTRNRSLSEYVPDPMQLPRRIITVSASHVKPAGSPDHVEASYETHMRREPHLSEVRGLTPVEKPPTPPPSETSLLLNDALGSIDLKTPLPLDRKPQEYFEAYERNGRKRRRWRAVKLLGQGTFSRVMLATSQMPSLSDGTGDMLSPDLAAVTPLDRYDRRTLVAIKVCEHGPKGGASEDRVEMSLKRELEIMRCIHHPSLVHLKAWNIEPSRAILVLSYCAGGDLFDVASTHRNLLTPALLTRVFAELVAAVRYLHERHIVHRDIKLENVLVNLSPTELADATMNWRTYPHSVTTLTDLGLSRRVSNDEKLETRCGSDDYAAPEVIMGQPYDGRATDAWSLGVLLYALLEGRLPFDPNPGMSDAHRMRSRTSHRIARVEWRWIEYAGDDGDHEGDAAKFLAKGLSGAMEITEGLLKRARSRWPMDRVAKNAWVRDGITVEGGLRFREEEEGEEVS